MIIQIVISILTVYITLSAFTLERNAASAKSMNIPVVRIPVDPNNVLWMIFQGYLWKIINLLPLPYSSLPYYISLTQRGWYFRQKSDLHMRFGPVWALVTPVAIYLHFSDLDAIHEIFSRRKDFVRPIREYKLLEVYGPCISTAGWDDWPRHRKPLAAPFNEHIMELVWNESLNQSKQMQHSWTNMQDSVISSIQKDTRTLSLNVLAAIGFRKSYEFRPSTSTSTDGPGSYRDALQTVLDNVILLMLVPYQLLAESFMPTRFAKLGLAAKQFKDYMVQMLEEESEILSRNKDGSGGLMTSFVRAFEVHKQEPSILKTSKDGKKGLHHEEILGNLFVINFAGHDTTANTLAFSMILLAAYPEVQTWLAEEINAVIGDTPMERWGYELFPRLKRCCAVLNETLRLFPPVMALPKWTSEKSQTLRINGQELIIPPGSGTVLSLLAVQTDPQHWTDPCKWSPSRWVEDTTGNGKEELKVPKRNIFFPWSDGPQNCPGRKFSEVETVAVLASIFKSHRLRVKKKPNETDRDACRRAEACANNVDMEMLLRMRDADSVTLLYEAI